LPVRVAEKQTVDDKILHSLLEERVRFEKNQRALDRKVQAVLREHTAWVVDRLHEIDLSHSLDEAEALLAAIRSRGRRAAEEIEQLVTPELRRMYEQEYDHINDVVDGLLGGVVDVNREEPHSEYAELPIHGVAPAAAIANVFERAERAVQRKVEDLWSEELQEAIDEGVTRREAETRDPSTEGKLGLAITGMRMLYSRRASRQLTRAVEEHSGAVFDRAVRQHSRENQNIYRGMQHSALLDENTCPICEGLHGEVWYYEAEPKISEAPQLPIHPHCRCIRSPVVHEDVQMRYAAAWEEEHIVDETTEPEDPLNVDQA